MDIRELHRWDVSPEEAMAIQQRLAPLVEDRPPLDGGRIRLIAGVDVSSEKEHPLLTAGVVVCNAMTYEIVEAVSAQCSVSFPYIPGLLSFRETPSLLQALRQLRSEPDVFLVDGQGIAHPRRFGIACHIGLLLDRPTIGVAKSILVGRHAELDPAAGSRAPLLHGGQQIGSAVRTRDHASPIFVSVGHKVDLTSAVALVLRSVRGYRIPEPTRLAHLHVNAVRRGERGLQPVLGTARVPSKQLQLFGS
jgi:deoxyribonuclease V